MNRLPATGARARSIYAPLLIVALSGAARGQPSAEPEPPPAPAEEPAIDIHFGGHLQLWWTALEQAENGLVQPLTNDEAAEVTSGFSIRRARLRADFDGGWMRARLSIRLENSPPGLLDAYAAVPIYCKYVELWAGQMKIPSTFEVARSSQDLDFITRSLFSQKVADLALSQSPSLSSPRFAGVRTYLRDTGVAIKGRVLDGSYFLMVGNGLGANRFIGGPEMKQEIFTNSPGAYFYAARVSYAVMGEPDARVGDPVAVVVGAHASLNRHPNVVLDDERTVVDLDRYTWSADLQAALRDRVRVHALIGAGAIGDENDNDGRDDYRFRGWDVGAVFAAIPRRLDLAARYDGFREERYENGFLDTLHTITGGVTYWPRAPFKLQLNYKWKHLDSDTDPDLDDNILFLMAQAAL